jgi:hypothetical protein
VTCKEPNDGQSDALGQNTGPKLTLVELDNCYVEIESLSILVFAYMRANGNGQSLYNANHSASGCLLPSTIAPR